MNRTPNKPHSPTHRKKGKRKPDQLGHMKGDKRKGQHEKHRGRRVGKNVDMLEFLVAVKCSETFCGGNKIQIFILPKPGPSWLRVIERTSRPGNRSRGIASGEIAHLALTGQQGHIHTEPHGYRSLHQHKNDQYRMRKTRRKACDLFTTEMRMHSAWCR